MASDSNVQYNDLSILQFVSPNRQEFAFAKILSHTEFKPIPFNARVARSLRKLGAIALHNALQH
jgi:hypothetical protein